MYKFFCTIIQFLLLIDNTKQSHVRQTIMALKAFGKTIKEPIIKTLGNTLKESLGIFRRNKNSISNIGYGIKERYMIARNSVRNRSIKYLGEKGIKKVKYEVPQTMRGGNDIFETEFKRNLFLGPANQMKGKEVKILKPIREKFLKRMWTSGKKHLIDMVSESKPQVPLLFVTGCLTNLTQINLVPSDDLYQAAINMEPEPIHYLNQAQALEVDEFLMSDKIGYPLEILMELAGQSITHAAMDIINNFSSGFKRVLVLCGPGNNGGDGLVAARHLLQYKGITPEVIIVKPYKKGHNLKLLGILENLGVDLNVYSSMTKNESFSLDSFQESNNYDLIIDALLGFSYKPPMRKPYDTIIETLKSFEEKIQSVDNPSGWDIEKGNIANTFEPKYNISLTLPKLGVKNFKGKHYLGGRFIPKELEKKYGFKRPEFNGNALFMKFK